MTSQQWKTVENGDIIGADQPTFLVPGNIDVQSLFCWLIIDGEEYTTEVVVVRYEPAVFLTQPSISPEAPEVGDPVTIGKGTTSATAINSVRRFELDDVDKIDELSGDIWDSTGEAAGTLLLQTELTNSGGITLSEIVTKLLVGQQAATAPAQMAAPTVAAINSVSISVGLAAAPSNGGSAINGYDLRWSDDEASWTTVLDISDPETIAGLASGTEYFVQTRAVNNVDPAAWSTSGSATTAADGASAPITITASAFTAGAGGTGPSVAQAVTYVGGRTLTLYGATITNPSAPSKAQLKAGSGGGILEAFSFEVSSPSDVDLISGLTATSEAADNVHYYIEESGASAQSSAIEVLTGVVIDATNPTFPSLAPADDGINFPVGSDMVATFGENVFFKTGNIVLRENNGGWSDLQTFDVEASGLVTISGAALIINPTADLVDGREYAIRIASTAIADASGNPFAGIASDTAWSFTAATGASSPIFMDKIGSTYLGKLFSTSALDIGAAGASRWVIVAITNNGSNDVSEVRIGGVIATPIASTIGSGGSGYFYAANVPLGTTAVVEVDTSVNRTDWAVHWWTMENPTFGTPVNYQNNATPHNTDINTTAGRSVLGISMALDGTTYTAGNITVTGLTKTSEQIVGNRGSVAAQADGVTAETPRTIQWAYGGINKSKFRSAVMEAY